jgi:hypothetical protein
MQSSPKINIYINVAVLGNVNQTLNGLLNKINDSGLYEACNFIKIAVNGDSSLLKIDFSDRLNKLIINITSGDITRFEFPGLKLLWDDSETCEGYMLYIHTKGVSRSGDKRILDWVNYLTFFNITEWRKRITDLEAFDCTGVNLEGDFSSLSTVPSTWGQIISPGKGVIAPVHYSGNFWWSKSDYIKKLPDPYKWIPDNDYFKWRIMAEMWVCQLNGKFRSAWNSKVNHYREPYPDFMYMGETNNRLQNIKRMLFRVSLLFSRFKYYIKVSFEVLKRLVKRLLINNFPRN